MEKKKAIVAGHICLDITPVFPDNKVADVSELLHPGKLVITNEAHVHTGGVVSNTGLAMKVLGANVSLIGKTGTDSFGNMLCSLVESYGVAADMIRSEEEASAYTIALAIPGLDRILLHNPGPNNTFCTDDIPEEKLEGVSLFHFGYPPLMKRMYENEGEELLKMFKKVKSAGCATSMDMAAVDPHSEAGKVDWKDVLEKVLPYVDFFVPSVEELCYMIDKERFDEWQSRNGASDITELLDVEADIKPLAKQCMALGAKVLLIKCGAAGMYYCTAGKEMLKDLAAGLSLELTEWADKEGFEYSFVPEIVRSGTGAGDTSVAAFLTAMLDECSVEECVRLAAATGASCVEAYDALSGLKSFDELREKIDAGWKKRK